MNKLKISFPTFRNFPIFLTKTSNLQKSINEWEFKKKYDVPDHAHAITLYDSDSGTYVFLPPDATIGTVAHECYHAVNNLMRHVGVEDEEAIAYHLDFVIEHAAKLMWGKKYEIVNRRKKLSKRQRPRTA